MRMIKALKNVFACGRLAVAALAVTVMLTGIPAAADAAEPVALQVCNAAPYPVQMSVLYLAQDSPARWDIEGWWTLEAGTCRSVKRGAHARYYYLYAESSGNVARFLYHAEREWTGTDTYGCVWYGNRPFTFADHRVCASGNGGDTGSAVRKGFRQIDTNFRDTTFTLHDRQFRGLTLEQAARLAPALQGRMEYESQIFTKPVKLPFRIGVTHDTTPSEFPGVGLSKVYAGLPAAEAEVKGGGTGLRASDRIVLINDRIIKEPKDIIVAVNEIGATTEAPRVIDVFFIRAGTFKVLHARMSLEYYVELDPRRTTIGGVQATASAFFDSVFLGFSSPLLCWVTYQLSTGFDYKACVAKHERNLRQQKEMYPTNYMVGDIGGMFVSLTRGVLAGVIKNPRILGSKTLARIGTSATIEAAEGMATVIGQARPGESAEELVARLKFAGALGAAFGGGFGAIAR